jgi:hypothetical protein
MVKKLVILSQESIDYIQSIAKSLNPKNKKGNFSKALNFVIEQYRWKINTHT